MDTFDAINQRRSVKAYDPNHRLAAAEETKLLEAAIKSPTSFNMQNWRFVIVRDTDLRKRIRAAAVDQAQVTDASLLIVLTADVIGWQGDLNQVAAALSKVSGVPVKAKLAMPFSCGDCFSRTCTTCSCTTKCKKVLVARPRRSRRSFRTLSPPKTGSAFTAGTPTVSASHRRGWAVPVPADFRPPSHARRHVA
jgi:hypothetical protein